MKGINVHPSWISIDEAEDVFLSLAEVERQVSRLREEPIAWKWATIALVSAINSALVANLSGTAQIGALEKENAKKTIAALKFGSEKDPPSPYLANPRDMLERAMGPTSNRMEHAGKPLNLTDDCVKSFVKLVDFRNEFLHFKPTSWLIEPSGFPHTFLQVLKIIEAAFTDEWSYRHMDENCFVELKQVHRRLRNQLAGLCG